MTAYDKLRKILGFLQIVIVIWYLLGLGISLIHVVSQCHARAMLLLWWCRLAISVLHITKTAQQSMRHFGVISGLSFG
jgi:hypothetical protein